MLNEEQKKRVAEVAKKKWFGTEQAELPNWDKMIAEAIEEVQNPKPKTYSEDAAKRYVVEQHNTSISLVIGLDTVGKIWVDTHSQSYIAAVQQIREWTASIIDSERADAAEQERGACARLAEGMSWPTLGQALRNRATST